MHTLHPEAESSARVRGVPEWRQKREGRERDITLQSVARRTVPSSRIKGCWMFTSIPGSRRPVCLVKT